MSRFHLICGNCGADKDWKWDHVPEDKVDGEIMSGEDVHLYCDNCSTIHSLNMKATKEGA